MNSLAERWWYRSQRSAFHAAPAFTERGLVLGHGTVLLPFARAAGLTLTTDAGHDRLVALLAVGGGGHLPADPSDEIAVAVGQWHRGDRALAAIRLAFAPLPLLVSQDDAYPLFLAETALDAGCSPQQLLDELGYASVAPLLKGATEQPRVPAGSGRASGRWTSGSESPGTAATPHESTSPRSTDDRHSDHDADSRPIPVFLAPEHHGENTIEDKPSPFRTEPTDEAIQHGHPLDPLVPGGAPLPFAFPMPNLGPSPRADEDDKDGPACPPMQNDVGHGASPTAQRFEAMIARLVNPSDPTPKQTPETPDVESQAYFLPQPAMSGGKVSYDDCKRTDEPSSIPGIKGATWWTPAGKAEASSITILPQKAQRV